MSAYVLPDLDYDYGALAPHITGRIMELHHGRHHAAYVKHANQILAQMEEGRATGNLRRSRGSRSAAAC